MEYIVKVKLPDELLNQAERAAASLGMTAEKYLRVALEEKLHRWAEDVERKQEFDRTVADLIEHRQELYRRLAQWPE